MSDTSKDSQKQNSTRLRGKAQESRQRRELTKKQALEDRALGLVMGEQPRFKEFDPTAGGRRPLNPDTGMPWGYSNPGYPEGYNFDPTAGGRRPLNPDTGLPWGRSTSDPLLESIMRRLGS